MALSTRILCPDSSNFDTAVTVSRWTLIFRLLRSERLCSSLPSYANLFRFRLQRKKHSESPSLQQGKHGYLLSGSSVEKCLKMCGLEAYADASVGSLGVELRKRTTIGVELAAKVSLVRFIWITFPCLIVFIAEIVTVFGWTDVRAWFAECLEYYILPQEPCWPRPSNFMHVRKFFFFVSLFLIHVWHYMYFRIHQVIRTLFDLLIDTYLPHTWHIALRWALPGLSTCMVYFSLTDCLIGIRPVASSSERRPDSVFWRPGSKCINTHRLLGEQWCPQMSSGRESVRLGYT